MTKKKQTNAYIRQLAERSATTVRTTRELIRQSRELVVQNQDLIRASTLYKRNPRKPK